MAIYEQSSEGYPRRESILHSLLSALEHLESRIKALEDKLVINSRNRFSPWSQDGFKELPPSLSRCARKAATSLAASPGDLVEEGVKLFTPGNTFRLQA